MAQKTGCIVCGKPLQYSDSAQELPCEICGKTFSANASCEDGHYICDDCHTQKGLESITDFALHTDSKDPVKIARNMMKNKYIYMHGPEHHYMTAAALLTAYRNAGGEVDLQFALEEAKKRAGGVPGGICGLWGACGAGICAGIFYSIISGATPLARENWGLANQLTSECLAEIAAHGGPRCCKRDVFLALTKTVDFVREYIGIQMEKSKNNSCGFWSNNNECLQDECLYFPSKGS